MILYYNIIIVWDHPHICGPLLTEMSLCGTYLYSAIIRDIICIQLWELLLVWHHTCINSGILCKIILMVSKKLIIGLCFNKLCNI